MNGRCAIALLGLVLSGAPAAQKPGETAASERPDRDPEAPRIRIERVPRDAEDEAALARLRRWREVYAGRLAALRRAAAELFTELERSSLATLVDRCRGVGERIHEIDRSALFPAPDPEIDRMLFGALERYRTGAAECLGGRYLTSYRLLLEAGAGLEWVDREVERRLAPRIPLAGLGPPD